MVSIRLLLLFVPAGLCNITYPAGLLQATDSCSKKTPIKSHALKFNFSNLIYIFHVPFHNQNRSHIFKEHDWRSIRHQSFYLFNDGNKNLHKIQWNIQSTAGQNVTFTSRAIRKDTATGSYLLESTVTDSSQKPLCPAPIYENVYLWIESDYHFLWSCVPEQKEDPFTDPLDDEAVLIFTTRKGEESLDGALKALKKYATGVLIERIKYEYKAPIVNNSGLRLTNNDLYACPIGNVETANTLVIGIIVAVVLVVGIAYGILCWCCC